MKITYKFTTGEVTEIEVSNEMGTVIVDSRRKEENLERCICRSLSTNCTDFQHHPCRSLSTTGEYMI